MKKLSEKSIINIKNISIILFILLYWIFCFIMTSCTTAKTIQKDSIFTTITTKRSIDSTIQYLNPIKQSFDSCKFGDTIRVKTKEYEIISFVDTTKQKNIIHQKIKPLKIFMPLHLKVIEEKVEVKKGRTYKKEVVRNFKALEKLLIWCLIGFIITLVLRHYLKIIINKW